MNKMSRSVYVSNFEDKERAEAFLEVFTKYHHRRHHQRGRSLFMEDLPSGHSGNVVPGSESTGSCFVTIPLYSDEPRSHGYDTAQDVIEIMKRIDSKMDNVVDNLEIKVEAT
jgi:hypothetical protein